jgi:peptide/nickel transport system substrate-binding protein
MGFGLVEATQMKSKRRFGVRLIAIVIAFSFVLPGSLVVFGTNGNVISPVGDDRQTAKYSSVPANDHNTFIYASMGEPSDLDPAVAYDSMGSEVLQNVYETLVWYDRESARDLIPMLATEIPSITNGLISADGKNVTFNLRQNVKMHDGTTMNADDVVYSIQRVLRMHSPSSPVWMLEAYMNGYLSSYIGQQVQNYMNDVATTMYINASLPADPLHLITEADVQAVAEAIVIKVNDSAVTFRLLHPYLPFVLITAYTVCDIVSKEFVEAHGGIVNGMQNPYMTNHCCGSGPYELGSWTPSDNITLLRFGNYHGTLPALSKVVLCQVPDYNVMIQMLLDGDVDSADISTMNESSFVGNPDIRVVKGLPTLEIRMGVFNFNIDNVQAATYGSNVTNDFFVDVHVRKAFCQLFDYATFNSTVLMGNSEQPNSVIVKGLFGDNASIPKYTYNLTAAQNELEQAMNITGKPGKSWWDDGFKIALFYNTGNTARQQMCLFLQKALNDLAPGKKFDATVNSLSWGSAYLPAMMNQHSFMPFYIIGWGPDFADADDYAQPFLYSAGTYPYYSNYNNSAIDTKILQAQNALDPVVRKQLYSEISMLAYEDPAYILAYQPASFHVERSWVQGYYFNPMYGRLYYAALSESGAGDITPPTTTIGLAGTPGSAGWYISNVTATLTATDNVGGSGVNYTKYRIDGGAWLTYTVPIVMSTVGSHAVEFYSVDLAGNTEATKNVTVKIDNTAPASTASKSGSAVTISSSDATSGVNTTLYRIDGGAWLTYAGVFNVTATGNHTIEYYSTDEAGNAEGVKTIYVDNGGGGAGISTGDLTPMLLLLGLIAAAIAISLFFLIGKRKKKRDGAQPPQQPQVVARSVKASPPPPPPEIEEL